MFIVIAATEICESNKFDHQNISKNGFPKYSTSSIFCKFIT